MIEKANTSAGLYWHYTDAAGLIGILESGVLRASSTLFMNDTGEISLGIERVKQVFADPEFDPSPRVKRAVLDWLIYTEKTKGRRLHTFLFCAAKDGGDSLAMWRGYGQGAAAYAIGLDPNHNFVHESNVIYPEDDLPTDLPWRHVAYTEAEHLALIRESFDLIDHGLVLGDDEHSQAMMSSVGELHLDSLEHEVKDGAFHDEKEVRFIVPSRDVALDQIKHRATKFGVTPYVEISTADEDGASQDSKLPILHVRVGPTTYAEQAILALRSILDKNGYESVPVSSSTAPFR